MVVFEDEVELGAEDLSLLLLLDAGKSATHDSDDHIENDQHGNHCADEENDPEDDIVVRVVRKVFSQLEVTQSQPVGVNEAKTEAFHPRVAWLI